MNIGLDAGGLVVRKNDKFGVYQSGRGLLKALIELGHEHKYSLYSFAPLKNSFGKNSKNLIARPSKGWLYFGLPMKLLLNRPDVFLGLSQSLPRMVKVPSSVMVYDLAYEKFPECYADRGRRLRKITKHAVKKAKRIIATSFSTKKDLSKIYGVSSKKIEVVYLSHDRIFCPQKVSALKKNIKKYSLPDKYFLYVGALKKSKNVNRSLEAFAKIIRNSKTNLRFVMTGKRSQADNEIIKTIEDNGLSKNVRFLDFVPQKNLPALYAGALALVSPSVYEGFGLPLLEAMACGCPVIGGDNSSQREIVDKSGILVNPLKIESIFQAMNDLFKYQRLRRKLVSMGMSQASKFSWESSAKQVLRVLNDL